MYLKATSAQKSAIVQSIIEDNTVLAKLAMLDGMIFTVHEYTLDEELVLAREEPGFRLDGVVETRLYIKAIIGNQWVVPFWARRDEQKVHALSPYKLGR